MRKLMSSNGFRLIRSKTFYLCLGVMILSALVNISDHSQRALRDTSEYTYTLDSCYYMVAPAMGLFIAVFASLFFGTEYSDGAIRNKLVVGHGRARVYLANLATCLIAAGAMLLAWLVASLAGIPVLGTWRMGLQGLAVYLGLLVLMTAALCAIFTLAAMMLTNKAVSAVFCILLSFALLMAASMLYSILNEPEMYSGIVMTMDGMQIGEPVPNPNYITGIRRTIAEVMMDVLPTGQGMLLADLAVAHPLRMGLSALGIFLITTLGGVILFGRKDLK